MFDRYENEIFEDIKTYISEFTYKMMISEFS